MLPPENPDEIFARKVPQRASRARSQCSRAALRARRRKWMLLACAFLRGLGA